jgi:hypothetical protein
LAAGTTNEGLNIHKLVTMFVVVLLCASDGLLWLLIDAGGERGCIPITLGNKPGFENFQISNS